jgi:hypothetical protein
VGLVLRRGGGSSGVVLGKRKAEPALGTTVFLSVNWPSLSRGKKRKSYITPALKPSLETQRRREEGEEKKEEDLTPTRGLARGHGGHREERVKRTATFLLR